MNDEALQAEAAGGQRETVVAAFDFDGTISRRDTLVPFLYRLAGPTLTTRVLASELPRSRGDRDALKHAVIARLVEGRSHAELRAEGAAYAGTLPDLLRPTMLDQIEWHRATGHHIVIVSASLRLYLEPLAERLGIEHLICVDLETDDAGVCTGGLAGANVRGPEKEVRLRSWFAETLGADPTEVWAYGDSSGDRELLLMAHRPMPVTAKAHRLVESAGLRTKN